MVTYFYATFKDRKATVKDLTVKVDDRILAKVTGLPAKGELYHVKENPDKDHVEFGDQDENFSSDRQ
ncbi:hypothetical protein KI387_016574, partial [Taxus chinensis]